MENDATTLNRFPPVQWRVAVACALVLTVLFAILAVPVGGTPSGARFWTTLRVQALTWGLWLLLLPFVAMAVRRAHRKGVTSVRGFAVHLITGSCLALVHATAFAILRLVLGLAASDSVGGVVAATVAFVIGGDILRYVVIAAAYHAVIYHSEARDRAVSEARMAANLAQARLEILEQRLHPHFLFNTLNSIGALIAREPSVATRMVEQLGELLRAALHAEPGREVPLSAELDLLERYTAIELVRFSDRLDVDVRAAPETLVACVPQLILQPLVENAIRHGVAPREAHGSVLVEAERCGKMLRLTVRDDGVGFGLSRAPLGTGNGQGIGINHTRERLAALYGDEFAMDIASNSPTGTIVTIDLPFHLSPLPARGHVT